MLIAKAITAQGHRIRVLEREEFASGPVSMTTSSTSSGVGNARRREGPGRGLGHVLPLRGLLGRVRPPLHLTYALDEVDLDANCFLEASLGE